MAADAPKPIKVFAGIGRVIQRVTSQATGFLRQCELVVRQGEMVEPNLPLAGGGERIGHGRSQCEGVLLSETKRAPCLEHAKALAKRHSAAKPPTMSLVRAGPNPAPCYSGSDLTFEPRNAGVTTWRQLCASAVSS